MGQNCRDRLYKILVEWILLFCWFLVVEIYWTVLHKLVGNQELYIEIMFFGVFFLLKFDHKIEKFLLSWEFSAKNFLETKNLKRIQALGFSFIVFEAN